MEKQELISLLKQKKDTDTYARLALHDPDIIRLLFEIIESDPSSLKFSCEKVIRRISESQPRALYPYFERMAKLMESGNTFIKWGFIQSLPNLLVVDEQGKWQAVHAQYLTHLQSEELVTFSSAVGGLVQLFEKYPQYEREIMPALLTIDSHRFTHKGECSPECAAVAKGHILDCFTHIFTRSAFQKEILLFARGCLENPRKQVRLKAAVLLKKFA